MINIKITDEAYQAVRAHASANFKSTGKRIAYGWLVPIDNDTYERLIEIRMDGENFSDVIMRAFAAQDGLN